MDRLHRIRWAAVIGGLLDDELGPDAFERALRHLDDCPECLEELLQAALIQRSLVRISGSA